MPLKIEFAHTFVKKLEKYKRKNPKVALSFEQKFKKFEKNPRDPSLKTHKLSVNMQNTYALSIEYDIRAIFTWEGEEVIFKAIGTHNQVY